MRKSALVALVGALLAAGAAFEASATATAAANSTTVNASAGAGAVAALPEKFATHSAALARLREGGLASKFPKPRSTGNCTTRAKGVTNCTSLEKVNKKTVDGMRIFAQKSGCKIQITGGTEWGHAPRNVSDPDNHTKYKSHWNGYKLDVSTKAGDGGTCVTDYVTTHYRRYGSVDGHPRYISGGGNWYVNEGNHWDVTYF
ncbi:hypothetical protein [Streptomyces syringium]|uniref:D-alanyl-D-alanine carboxypeptidase n=1 Tax=Streptomyces syringium TaxID=76729 RepID=A0ABS4XVQ0_9ACTN|nr:hypothetical protein [Streptomyces syringium]MBP2400591.1 hypothetical protein [Streptomyces syringium]